MEEKELEVQNIEEKELSEEEKKVLEAKEIEKAEREAVKESVDRQRSKYVVSLVRDERLLKMFVKFSNRVKHPRTTGYMVIVGATLFMLPFVNKGIALPGVVISHVMGALMVLMGLFRHEIGTYMLKSNPQTKLGEELVYLFGNTGVKVEKDGVIEHVGSYKKIYRLWEDEKTFYIGIGEDDLLVLPKNKFEVGDVSEFRDFILEKSRCIFTWKPVRIDHVIKQIHLNMKANPIRFGFQPKDKE